MTDNETRLPLTSVALISGAALAAEILLTRAFSIVHWHHFAAMIVSLALLGFGASGTFLTFSRDVLLPRIASIYPASMIAFGVAALVSPLVAQRLPLNAQALLWDPWQPLWLLAVYVTLAVPFFFAATALGLALSAFHATSGRIYAADLVGAGLGSVAILVGLNVCSPESLLRAVAVTAGVAAVVGANELARGARRWLGAAGLIAVLALLVPAGWLRFEPGPYKTLSQALEITGSEIVLERSSALARIDVVANSRVPLRYAPGLSLAATGEPPEQLALYTDGDALDAITGAVGDRTDVGFLQQATGALGHAVRAPRTVLVIGAGGGLEILRARAFGASRIDALEIDARKVELLQEDFEAFSGQLADQPGIRLSVGEPRGWLAAGHRYDLIVLASSPGGQSGLAGLNEDYVLTRQALELYLEHLEPGGFLSVTGAVQLPPREGLRIIATARAALEALAIPDHAQRFVMIRGWQTWTLLVKNGVLTPVEIERTRGFADALSFDLVWHPGLRRQDANVFNQLREPFFHDGARAILGDERDAFLRDYAFDVTPATDDRPYFHDSFRWNLLDDVLETRDRGGMALLEAGYVLLLFVAGQALVAAFVLIVLPLAIGARVRSAGVRRWRVLGYFAALGIAFLFLEIAFLQKLILLIHEPTTAFAVTVATFLIGAGLGSAWSMRTSPARTQRTITMAAVTIAILATANAYLIDVMNPTLAGWPLPGRMAVAAALLLPLAFWMGVPFPTALRRLEPALVPWAWGINGCASVVSATGAALLSVGFGFRSLVLIAIACYAVTPLVANVTQSEDP